MRKSLSVMLFGKNFKKLILKIRVTLKRVLDSAINDKYQIPLITIIYENSVMRYIYYLHLISSFPFWY